MSSINVFPRHWTNDISMRQFIDQFKHRLPQLLRTTSGYSDVDNINDIGTDEEFVVVGIQRQERVIAETHSNRFVSIPLNSRLLFRRLTSKTATASEATTLNKLHADGQLEGQRVEMECDTTMFDLSTYGKCSEKLGILTVRDTYNERYLVARSVFEGVANEAIVGIPVYLPITVQVAAELDREIYQRMLRRSPLKTENVLCEEVLVFDECPNGDYEYVNPTKYARASMISTSSQSSLPSGARGPQQQQVPSTKECSRPKPLHAASPHQAARGFESKTSGSKDDDEDEDDESSDDYEKISDSDNDYEQPGHLVAPTRMAHHTLSPGVPGIMNNYSVSTNYPAAQPVDRKPPLAPRQLTEPARSTQNASPIAGLVPRQVPLPPRPPAAAPTSDSACSSEQLQTTTRRTPEIPPPMQFTRTVDSTPGTSEVGAIVFPVSNAQPVPMQAVSPMFIGSEPCPPICPVISSTSASTVCAPSETASKGQPSVVHQSPSKLEENAIWQTLYDVPLNVEDFTVEELCKMLQLLRMPSLAVAFREQCVDGQLMMSIVTEESLVNDFNCSTFEAKKLIQFVKYQWRPKQ